MHFNNLNDDSGHKSSFKKDIYSSKRINISDKHVSNFKNVDMLLNVICMNNDNLSDNFKYDDTLENKL